MLPQIKAACCAILMASLFLSGCGSNLLSYTSNTPALVHSPIKHVGIIDQRLEFRRILCQLIARDLSGDDGTCTQWLIQFSDEAQIDDYQTSPFVFSRPTTDIMIVNGIFGECIQNHVSIFSDATSNLINRGYKVDYVPIKGRASSKRNAEIIHEFIVSNYDVNSPRKIVIVSYSKGTADTLTALATYPDLQNKIAAILSIAGAVNGSPVADGIQALYDSAINALPLSECERTDKKEILSITRSFRLNWLAENSLPKNLLYFSIVTAPQPERISTIFHPFYKKLAAIDPRNDGQLIYYDQVIPNSILLGYVNADHWAVAMPFEKQMPKLSKLLIDKNHYPRSQLLEASIEIIEKNLINRSNFVP
ncbi:hypothetical protein ACO0LM_27140 [Undibacterium sp. Di26W]|uniref:hypothetical protein n=1 Tax=Undibacterium sp. Di26W TaxID=3413035 RepID=UPI003BF07100